MTYDLAYTLGKRGQRIFFTDEELDQHIYILGLVINYLNGRGDAKIIVNSLNRDLNRFNDYKFFRRTFNWRESR